MSLLILIVLFAVVAVGELFMLARNAEADRVESERSRKAMLAELRRREMFDPASIIDGGDQ